MEPQSPPPDELTAARTRYQPVWAFILLSYFSFGIYTVYWFYENWRQVRDRENWDIYPVWRALFAIFFTHALLCDIDDRAVEKGHPGSYPNWLATGYVLTALASNIASRMLPDAALLLLLLAGPYWFLVPAVRQLNFIALQEGAETGQPAFLPGERVVLIAGGFLFLLALIVLATG